MAELPKVYWPAKPSKILTPSTEAELAALLRIGYKKVGE